jgi:hypothetical protein
MKTPVEPSHCPFATRARAAEIALRENALQEKFGLIEFTELTGVGHSDYGIYRIDPKGVSLRAEEPVSQSAGLVTFPEYRPCVAQE